MFSGKVSNLFFNFAGTREFLENERRGLFSYQALKSRLETNKFESQEIRDFAQPVIRLMPLDATEIFVLLQKLKQVFDINYKTNVDITSEDIQLFMEELFNRPGANEFLTPREVIRDFLHIMSILRQNPGFDKATLFADIEVKDERPVEEDLENIKEI
nr:BREX system ATP-binding domain-containing protein [Chitinophaga pinensis]